MATTKHGLAQGHEICDGMVAIANELATGLAENGRGDSRTDFLEVVRDQCLGTYQRLGLTCEYHTYNCLGVVELHSSCQSALGELSQLRDDELIELQGWFSRVCCAKFVCMSRPLRTSFGASCIVGWARAIRK